MAWYNGAVQIRSYSATIPERMEDTAVTARELKKYKKTNEARVWNAALYVRLSREDGDKDESDSIANQRELLKEFVKLEPDIRIQDIYVDDGWSGTNFDRPEFMRMAADIENGAADCVIVKDLSRFGRNYIDVGRYIEQIFPLTNIRFIAVSENIDSVKNPQSLNSIIVPFKNLINDEYCRDISNKVRSSLDMKRKQGKHIGSFACYGYIKNPNEHNAIIPDPEAAAVVCDIFAWFNASGSVISVTRKLNEAGIPNPTKYKQLMGLNYRNTKENANDGLWCDRTVRRILTSEMYIGTLVQGVNRTKSYKVQKSERQAEKDWIVVEGTHEALISRKDFDTAQEILSRSTRAAPGKQQGYLFSGFLRCADCGKSMNRKLISQPYKTYCYYVCSTFKKAGSSACAKHAIRSDKLEEAVLAAVQSQIALAVDMEQAVKAINEAGSVNRESARLRESLNKAEAEREKLENAKLDLYPDLKAGIITRDEYLPLKARFAKRISDAEAVINDLKRCIEEAQKGQNEQNLFLKSFTKYKNIRKLNREVVVALIDSILIKDGGSITIHFKYRNPYAAAKEFISNNDAALEKAKNKKQRSA